MNENGSGRRAAWSPLFFSVVMVAGMVLGFNLRDTLRNKRDVSTVFQRNDRLEEIIDLIGDKYVDSVDRNMLYKNSISGILKNLDPHTVYIPAEDMQRETEDLEGSFSGIGVEFAIVRDTIQVTSVIENGPAGTAGVQIGDQVIKVGDSLVAGVKITTERIVHLLRGKQKSNVYVTLRNAETGHFKNFPITRDVISVKSVEADIMLDDSTGYIKLNKFSANTGVEFHKALQRLASQGLKQLVVDLRDNPGGYLDAATSIADEFLDDTKLIVYTQGLHMPKTEYRAGKTGKFEAGRLALLVDEGSASASEILSGAIQDWDRGIIVGRRSFGKGLVQEQYEMADGAGLRLTVAKYYTPSGRCIQRTFAKGRQAYLEDYEKRFSSGELNGAKNDVREDTTPYYTAAKRIVHGGGGIKPDVFVPYDTDKINSVVADALYGTEVKTAVWDYFIRNHSKLDFKAAEDFRVDFKGADDLVAICLKAFDGPVKERLLKRLKKPTAEAYFKAQLTAQLARLLFQDNGYYSVAIREDDDVKAAVKALQGNTYSELVGGK
jgi:carboxyl-terminal processing protease